jgi:hypothetical protein
MQMSSSIVLGIAINVISIDNFCLHMPELFILLLQVQVSFPLLKNKWNSERG